MKNNHLTYFKIENFKKFDSLEVNDIGQFNLIVGDNNVGKTCLLEALLFDEEGQQLLSNFYLALTKRGLKFQIEEITKKIGNISTTETIYPKGNYFETYILGKFEDYIAFTINNKSYSVAITNPEDLNSDSLMNGGVGFNFKSLNSSIPIHDLQKQLIHIYDYKTQGEFTIYWIYNYNESILNFPLISFNDTPLTEESKSIYENLKTKREKQILIDVLKVVNPNIVDIEFRENFEDLKSVFLISFEDKDEYFPLNFLGDGFKRIFYIVLKALSLKGKRILIDEIEIGIHHSKMKDFWINLMKVCKELNVQLFATTHSQECTEAFVDASNVLKVENNIRLIKLEESSNKDKIYASTFTYNQISAGLDSNVELRG